MRFDGSLTELFAKEAMDEIQRAIQTRVDRMLREKERDGWWEAGARASLASLLEELFSIDGIRRAVQTHEANAHLHAEDRMGLAIASAINAEEFVTLAEPDDRRGAPSPTTTDGG